MQTATPAPEATPAERLPPEVAILLDKLLEDLKKTSREEITPGTYEVRAVLGFKVRGTVKVGEDYSQRVVQSARPWGLVAILLEELQQKSLAAGEVGLDLDRLVARSLALDPKVEKQAQERADKIAAALKAETRKTCAGKVTCTGTLEVIR